MNWRYFYIASVVALSYVLFLSWNAEKEIKQEVQDLQTEGEDLYTGGGELITMEGEDYIGKIL